ncbi:MAG: PDZ domain-containing protein [Syntrophobacterales bacterium]|nr:PDZ domain-containing protein [Syntrophobacterales bacterium]
MMRQSRSERKKGLFSLLGIWLAGSLWAGAALGAKTTVSVTPVFYREVEEAARALQAILTDVRIMKMLPSDKGGYDPARLPLQAFVLGPKTLTLRYKVPRLREGSGVIYTRPVPLHFSTQTPEEVEESKTFPLDRVKLSSGLMAPEAKDPTWSLWVILPGPAGLPDITDLATSSRDTAETLYNVLISLMAAARNPQVPQGKVPASLTFEKGGAGHPAAAPPPKLGFSVVPSSGGQGLGVTEVEKGSPADKAGLAAGDILLAVNGTEVSAVRQLPALLKPEENILTVSRGGKTIKLKVVTPVSF